MDLLCRMPHNKENLLLSYYYYYPLQFGQACPYILAGYLQASYPVLHRGDYEVNTRSGHLLQLTSAHRKLSVFDLYLGITSKGILH